MSRASRRRHPPPSRFLAALRRISGLSYRLAGVWRRLILTSLAVALVVLVLDAAHVLEGFELRWLDVMAFVDRPALRAPITVVAITDRDYDSPALFGGMSPLHPLVLRRLILAVAEQGPRGAILDVQIHPAPYETQDRADARLALYRTLDSLARADNPAWILVRDAAEEVTADVQGIRSAVRSAWTSLTGNGRIRWADPALWSVGGVVRVVSKWPLERAETPARLSVLGSAIEAGLLIPRREWPGWLTISDRQSDPWHIRYTGHFLTDTADASPYRISAGALLSERTVPGQRLPLHDRIVLIGGTYSEGRDQHPTPVGEMAGVYVWAEALASWIRHDALREPARAVTVFLESLIGIIAGLLLLKYGPGWGLVWSVLGILPLSILCSVATFGGGVLFVNFLPSFVAVYLHYQVELHLELRRLKRRASAHRDGLERSRREVRRLKGRIRSLTAPAPEPVPAVVAPPPEPMATRPPPPEAGPASG